MITQVPQDPWPALGPKQEALDPACSRRQGERTSPFFRQESLGPP